jgi:hypothetical protein
MNESLIRELLEYEAPFLIEKLRKENIVETEDEGKDLFLELKRWLILIHRDFSKNWEMYSLRVDEVWHQFILYSSEYYKFCLHFFGAYVMHSPSNAPKMEIKDAKEYGSFDDFKICYKKIFNIPIPDLWFDEKSINVNRRVVNYFVKKLGIRDLKETVNLINSKGEILVSVNEVARDAISFIIDTPAFYVRELPGELTNDEKIALVHILVEFKLLRAAS